MKAFERAELARLGLPQGIIMRHRPAHFQHLFASSACTFWHLYMSVWITCLKSVMCESVERWTFVSQMLLAITFTCGPKYWMRTRSTHFWRRVTFLTRKPPLGPADAFTVLAILSSRDKHSVIFAAETRKSTACCAKKALFLICKIKI
jgi:hypothetical protein